MNQRDQVCQILQRQKPEQLVYAPNYWQWFTHHRNQGLLPSELSECESQLDLIRYLGLTVFSRNIYCDPAQCWFGGLADEIWDGIEVEVKQWKEKPDTLIEKQYHTCRGTLTERFRYVFGNSTLVQEKFLVDDLSQQMGALEEWVMARRWRFDRGRLEYWSAEIGEDGLLNAGELFSPLKFLHLIGGAEQAVYWLMDHPEACHHWMQIHETAQLDLVRQMLDAGVDCMIAMDNLDTAFHSPRYVEQCSASFYEKASQLCHDKEAVFFIHACGGQRANLPLIASLGVDGLEGVAYPKLGDIELDEALQLAGEHLIITGGISPMETEAFQSYDEVRWYLEDLFRRIKPYQHRFMLSASCNTSIRTPWKVIRWFRDAWRELES